MQSPESIVVGTDGSETVERAVDRAGVIARALAATVDVVSAHSKDDLPLVVGGRRRERPDAQRNVERARERLAKLGVETEAHLSTREAGKHWWTLQRARRTNDRRRQPAG